MDVQPFLSLLSALRRAPDRNVWITYDEEADVLYINFRKPSIASDSELTDDDVIVRYADDQVVGYTVLHASQRSDGVLFPD
jgi:uncharacterized protein YuzE